MVQAGKFYRRKIKLGQEMNVEVKMVRLRVESGRENLLKGKG